MSDRHFLQYHKTEDMGLCVSSLSEPCIYTNKSVGKLSSNIVWVVSGEGLKRRSYYLSSVFRVKKVAAGTYVHPGFKNFASGDGIIISKKILLNDFDWFPYLASHLKRTRYSLAELKDAVVKDNFRKLVEEFSPGPTEFI